VSFIATIQGIRDGQLVSLLTDELQDVITSVIEHSKGGSISLKLKIEPNGDNAVTITSEVDAKQARPAVGKAIFYADTGGTLHRRDPRQGDMIDELARKREEAK
jgi:hypothetical protein